MSLRFIYSVGLIVSVACTSPPLEPSPPLPVGSPPKTFDPPPTPRTQPTPEPPTPQSPPRPEPDLTAGQCPQGMVYIDTEYCTAVQQPCLEPPHSNMRRKCIRWSAERTCVGTQRRQRFCIDRYEYPNQKGAHPVSMLDAADAAALCHVQGKRLCWESEWTAACEGARKLPYPYGLQRDPTQCRIDVSTPLFRARHMRSLNKRVSDRELERIDRSVPSGSMPGCTSDFGVFDLTGNFSEWVFLERARGNNTWAGQKGGHWKPPVRNACRPTGTGHNEPWTFYTLSFRCCAEPKQPATQSPTPWTPPKLPTRRFPKKPRRLGWDGEWRTRP